VIEGFITPQPFDPILKLAFSTLTAIGLALYLNHRPRAADKMKT
jgi:hypothetical protein